MRIDWSYEIWEAVAPDDSRPWLTYVNIERLDGNAGVAIAGYDFILAVVPIWLEEDDHPGLVQATTFKAVHGLGRIQGSSHMRLGPENVVFLDGSSHPRRNPTHLGTLQPFPDWRAPTAGFEPGAAVSHSAPALNMVFTQKLWRALGKPMVRITPLSGSHLLLIETLPRIDGRPTPPFGFQARLRPSAFEAEDEARDEISASILGARRRHLGLTQADLAERLGVARDTVARWERGTLTIQHPKMLSLALGSIERNRLR